MNSHIVKNTSTNDINKLTIVIDHHLQTLQC